MKRIISLFIVIIIALSLSGCDKEFSLKCRIGEFPTTLDPQMASTEIQMIIAHNTFEGLMRLDKNNTPVPASCESVSVSDDGKEYTFVIKKNLKWSNGNDLTVDDFYFGLIRALDSQTGAPYGYLLGSIKGAKESLAGNRNASVGINVVDSRTLKITLSEKDDNFLYNLCHPVASPCNKEYFTNCKGKYGITAKTIISNGTFKTAYHVVDTTIRISQNAYYNGKFKTSCTSVEFDFKKMEEPEYYDSIAKNSWGITYIDDNTDINKINIENFNKIDSYTSAYYLLLNPQATGCKKQEIRNALVLSISDFSNSNITKMNNWLPSDVTLCGAPISSLNGISDFSVNSNNVDVKQLFLKNSNQQILNSLKNAPFYSSQNVEINNIAKGIAASWQKELGVYMNIEAPNDQELISKISDGNFNVALVKIDAKDRTAASLLNSIYKILGEPENLKQINQELLNSKSTNHSISLVNSYNVSLTENYYAVPVSMASTSYICAFDYDNIFINSNGVIDFSFIRKN